jgi:hypothetical protein
LHRGVGAPPTGSPQLGHRSGPRCPQRQACGPPPRPRARHSWAAMGGRENLLCRCNLPDAQAHRLLCAACGSQLGQLRPRQGSGVLRVLRHGNTRTCSFLHRHGVLDIDHCPYCLDTPEDVSHLFFRCPPRRRVLGTRLPRRTSSPDLRGPLGARPPPTSCATLPRSSSSGSYGRATIG